MTSILRAGRRSCGPLAPLAAAILTVLALAPERAEAAERTVWLALKAPEAECSVFDPFDCSYLLARNGNLPAPDPLDPDAIKPSYINFIVLGDAFTIEAVIADDGTVTVPDGGVNIPPLELAYENQLVGLIEADLQLEQTAPWTGTFSRATGELELTAPVTLSFKLKCDPAAPTLCGAVFPGTGNMGTWHVRPKSPLELTTGPLNAPPPPAGYGNEWVPASPQAGSPLNAETGLLTLVGTGLSLHTLEAADCVDPDSVACSNPAIGELVSPELRRNDRRDR